MSKKRWRQPNERLWTLVFMIGFFMMSADNFAILLVALAVMAISVYKLRGIDLSEECDIGLHFNGRQCADMATYPWYLENRIKIPFMLLWRVRRALKTQICVFLILTDLGKKVKYEKDDM